MQAARSEFVFGEGARAGAQQTTREIASYRALIHSTGGHKAEADARASARRHALRRDQGCVKNAKK
jgi:hypothetical protein